MFYKKQLLKSGIFKNKISLNNISFAVVFIFLITPKCLLSQSSEYTVKTAYIEKFTQFVEWPEESEIADTTQPFILCIIGKSPFGQILDNFYREQKLQNKKVDIKYISNTKDIQDCHLLFICSSMKEQLDRILEYTHDKPILTIADTEDFAKMGVHINMYQSDDKIRFEINSVAIKESSLRLSYLLYSLAKIINPIGGNNVIDK